MWCHVCEVECNKHAISVVDKAREVMTVPAWPWRCSNAAVTLWPPTLQPPNIAMQCQGWAKQASLIETNRGVPYHPDVPRQLTVQIPTLLSLLRPSHVWNVLFLNAWSLCQALLLCVWCSDLLRVLSATLCKELGLRFHCNIKECECWGADHRL